jgi:hypothetical protein
MHVSHEFLNKIMPILQWRSFDNVVAENLSNYAKVVDLKQAFLLFFCQGRSSTIYFCTPCNARISGHRLHSILKKRDENKEK